MSDFPWKTWIFLRNELKVYRHQPLNNHPAPEYLRKNCCREEAFRGLRVDVGPDGVFPQIEPHFAVWRPVQGRKIVDTPKHGNPGLGCEATASSVRQHLSYPSEFWKILRKKIEDKKISLHNQEVDKLVLN